MRWPWTHPETRRLLTEVAGDLRRAVMELEAETNKGKARHAELIQDQEGTDGEHRR